MAKTSKKDQDEELTNAHEEIEEQEIDLAADSLMGDIRDVLLGRIHNMKKPWEQCSESEQREIVEQMTKAAENICRRAVKLIAANGRTTITARMHDIKISKGVLEAKIKTKATDETVLRFKGSQENDILVIAADAAEYEGERAPAEIQPDQPELEQKLAARASNAKTSKRA